MNNARRKDTDKIIANIEDLKKRYEQIIEQIEAMKEEFSSVQEEIERVRDEEQEYRDNMPENVANGEKGGNADAAVEQYDTAKDAFDEEFDAIDFDAIVQALDEAKQ